MPFTPEEWARVKGVFDRARPLPVGERRVFVAGACAGEPGLQEHVEKLLAAHQLASGFLETPPILSHAGPMAVELEWQDIAGYQLTSLVGAGGMGEVYKAHDPKLDRPVALKLLPEPFAANPDWLRRFRAEAKAASSLNHPHILVVHDVGDFKGRPFIVMEFVEGRTIRERIDEGPVPVKEAIGIASQIASALAAAHARAIVHRDIKPENVMLRPDGYVKVLDFGLARQVVTSDGTLSGTQSGALVGTLRYMSPEQSRGEPAQPASDVFSLGLLFFELISGRHPFHADSTIGVLHGIQSAPPVASGGGPELDALVFDMLAKDPRQRPAVSDVVARLSALAIRAPLVEFVSRRRTSVGRERERGELRAAFEAAERGSGQLVAVAGEPGIGKSTLVDDFLSEIATPVWLGRGRCSERLAGAEAHLPFLEALDSLIKRDPAVATLIKHTAPGWFVQIAPMSPEDSSAARLLADTRSGSAERLMREMAALLLELASSRPFVLFLDDVHWADVSTIDMLRFLAPKLGEWRGMIIVTYRPADLAISRHPFQRLKADLGGAHRIIRELPVAFLTELEVGQYVSSQLPAAPDDVAALIYRKTEGSPLFMVDLVRYLQERDLPGGWRAEIERNVPESLRGMIERKLETLEDDERQLLRVAAVQGVEFDSAIVAQVLGRDPADVEDTLQSLDRVHGLVQLLREQEFPSRLFSLRYQFVHALYQSALYASVSPTRRSVWSGKVAEALEREHGDRKRTVAAELALLYEMARDPWRASEHFLAAAELASARFATREALAFAKKGLACLALVRDRPDIEVRELALQKALLHPLAVLEGYGTATTERVSRRIVELAERLEDHGSLFAALDATMIVHMVRGECPEAAKIADRMIAVAEQSGSEIQQMNALWWATTARHHLGDLHIAAEHANACIPMGTVENQATRVRSIFDPIVGTLCESGRNSWMLGNTRECIQRAVSAVEIARAIRHPDSLSFALLFHGWMHGHREDWQTCLASTAEAIAFSAEQSLVQTKAWNDCVHGWALAHTGRSAEGLAEIQHGIEDSLRIMGHVAMPHFVAMLAEVLVIRGEHGRALDEIARILRVNESLQDAYFNAELHRLAAECHLALDEREEAEAALGRAIETARSQGALTFELRAATAFARLCGDGENAAAARASLQRVLDALGDAEDTADVRRARACLAASSN
jgi:tetratricopeptide (TPR) repeat protein